MAMSLCAVRRQVRSLRFYFCTRNLSSDDSIPESKKNQRPHPETPQFPDEYSTEPLKGKIYDKKPFRLELMANKNYFWCVCGTSKSQPLCDGSHKKLWGTSQKKNMPKWQPLRFKVEETKEYWLCNCKQTDKQPFCDGTHKQPHIQAAVK
ncbi:CDGSH iron-sulfur domain-containing protein 3, mitochondrial-like isoform X2 [Pomacea canaliculata]|uniref:CDGSH iron-sulfur domain-containing protein 3, mitochondrial-like isoform X2 n=1 Tax=Pomacea canaliculata TaxID=400727 RepID=UPI000D732777|nr:CDGSH iron-sulfur domain-containing protein 3, mitochondrial-like isoform X2 [Pomacea canaliculata]